MTQTKLGRTTTVFAEGKILGAWVPEVRSAIDAIPDGHARKLDLGGVTFVDAEGAELISMLRRDGIEIVSCSHFLADLLDRYNHSPPR